MDRSAYENRRAKKSELSGAADPRRGLPYFNPSTSCIE
jgi:hypothetical protein